MLAEIQIYLGVTDVWTVKMLLHTSGLSRIGSHFSRTFIVQLLEIL